MRNPNQNTDLEGPKMNPGRLASMTDVCHLLTTNKKKKDFINCLDYSLNRYFKSLKKLEYSKRKM